MSQQLGTRMNLRPHRALCKVPFQVGFTLIELLIALGIMAVFSLLAYRGLDSVLRLDAAAQAHDIKSSDLVRTFTQLEADLRQAYRVQWSGVGEQERLQFKRHIVQAQDSTSTSNSADIEWVLVNGVWTRSADGTVAKMLPNVNSIEWYIFQATAVPSSSPWLAAKTVAIAQNIASMPVAKAVMVKVNHSGVVYEKAFLIGR